MHPHPYHEIFSARLQPQLLSKSFHPTEAELEFAKHSLAEKHKFSFGTQQLLFCKKEDADFLLPSEKVIESERKKYVEFIKKNYNQKLSDELFSLPKLKQRIREFEEKQRNDAAKDDEDIYAKKVGAKKRAKETKPAAGKKKVKAQQPVKASSKAKKAPKKQQQAVEPLEQEAQQVDEAEVEPSEDSLELNLINSLSQDDFEGDYE